MKNNPSQPAPQAILIVDPAEQAKLMQKLKDWSDSIAKDKKCINCGNGSWISPGNVAQIFQHTGKIIKLDDHDPIYPFILLICDKCGYTEFYNAAIAGFVKKAPPEGEAQKNP